jgi:carotenoid cleavage dioxygenase
VVHQFDAKGQLIDSLAVQKPKPTMIHDMMITKSFIIVFDCPLVFDVEAAMAGESVLQWQAKHPTIIRLFQKNNLHAPAITIPLDPFFMFHFANAYESKGCILIDYIRYDYLKIINEQMNIPGMTLHRMEIDIKSHQVTDVAMHSPKMEFPTINSNYLSKPYQFVYAIHQKH